jgi:hypothetical protein
LILDTDILIWFLRGNDKAETAVVNSIPFSVSIVTYMELLQGMRNRSEMEIMKKAFHEMGVSILPISNKISIQAARYVEEYALSNHMEMADALIASTCIEHGEELYTANDKHYKVINDLRISIFRP